MTRLQRTRAAVLAAVASAALAAGAPAPSRGEDGGGSGGAGGSRRVVELGPTAAQRASSAAQLEFPFAARADEELIAATVLVTFAPPDPDVPPIGGVEVLVNDERVALLEAGGAAGASPRHAVPVPRQLLAPRNQLAVRLVPARSQAQPSSSRGEGGAPCDATPGLWRAVEGIGLDLRGSPVPLPDDLALLPMPFVDRGFDDAATIPIALAGPVTPELARTASIVASAIAVDAPLPVTFTARVGELPEGRGVVVVDGPVSAARFGVEPLPGPAVRMEDNPRHPGSNAKLLVVGGRDEDELRVAAEGLAARRARLVGREVRLSPPPPEAPAPPYSAPRWVQSDRLVRFGDYPEAGSVFAHDGGTPTTLSVRFRVAPDLWIWPRDLVALDLGWSERLPPGAPVPRLDVEMNGHFLATLPRPTGPGDHGGRVRLRIPREDMRGFNELRVYASYPDACGAAASSKPGAPGPHVEIARDSVLHIEGLSHFASLPDVSLFAYDGYPFTRIPDLGETAFVLPDAPSESELGLALSIAAKLSQVTGRIPSRARFVAAGRASDAALAGEDLIVVGGADNALFARWSRLLPIALAGGRARVQVPAQRAALLDLLGGPGQVLDGQRAREVLSRAADVAALAAIESPLSPGRSVVFVTGSQTSRLPAFGDFLGYAESRARRGDLLVLSGGRRFMFHIGPEFGLGRLDAWTRLRWFLANHWLLLLPVLAVGVLLLAPPLRAVLSQRMRERLALSGGES